MAFFIAKFSKTDPNKKQTNSFGVQRSVKLIQALLLILHGIAKEVFQYLCYGKVIPFKSSRKTFTAEGNGLVLGKSWRAFLSTREVDLWGVDYDQVRTNYAIFS